MPNEIFTDLQLRLKNARHIGFAYSYYYLINALYRYCKYDGSNLRQSEIRHLLGYNDKNSNLDQITKPNGILDQMGYTKYIKDFPLSARKEDGFLEFEMFNQVKQSLVGTNINNYKVKYPTKAFHRNDISLEDGVYDGTFYNVSNTHGICVWVFEEIVKEIGTVSFYIFGFLRHMNNMHKEKGYQTSLKKFATDCGISKQTLLNNLERLEEKLFISITHQDFIYGLPEEERIANTYHTIV